MTKRNNTVVSKKKRQLYIALLTFIILFVFLQMFLQELVSQQRISITYLFLSISKSIIILILVIVNALFVKEFIKNKWGLYVVCFLNGGAIIIYSLSFTIPFLTENYHHFRTFNIIACTMFLSSILFTFYAAVKDIFKIKHDLNYSLLGAVNIFLIIGIIFSLIVNIMGSIFIGTVLPIEQLFFIDNNATILSFYTIANVDLPYSVNPFIRNILVIESIFSHLYIVMIVGRLLSK